jgi:hypothetical protein
MKPLIFENNLLKIQKKLDEDNILQYQLEKS